MRHQHQPIIRILTIYMVTALLFLTSFELHIHTDEAAMLAEHGSAVSISSLGSDFAPDAANEEINVGLDGVLKIEHDNFVAVFILIAVMIIALYLICIGRMRKTGVPLFAAPSGHLPPLRAPPL